MINIFNSDFVPVFTEEILDNSLETNSYGTHTINGLTAFEIEIKIKKFTFTGPF